MPHFFYQAGAATPSFSTDYEGRVSLFSSLPVPPNDLHKDVQMRRQL